MKKIFFFFAISVMAMTIAAQNLNVGTYTKIDIDGPYEVNICKGNNCSVQLDASEGMAQYAVIYVSDGKLHISIKKTNFKWNRDKYLKVNICLQYLEEIETDGACRVMMSGKFNAGTGQFKADMNGASSIKGLDIDAVRCSVDMDGATNLQMTGKFSTFLLDISGASKAQLGVTTKTFECEAEGASGFSGIKTETAQISIDGASHGEMEATESLNVKLEGASSLTYSGPENLRINKQVDFTSSLKKK